MTDSNSTLISAAFDLYPKSRQPFDTELFKHPTSEYRGAPFWSINGPLDRAELLRQLEVFQQMGMGGAQFHVRTGLTVPYLSNEFMDHVRACSDYCREHGMLFWLYDEDRWPSGGAGGKVTSEPSFRRKHLLLTQRPYENFNPDPWMAGNSVERTENGTLIARYAVELRDGLLHRYQRLADGEEAWDGARVWYAYLESGARSVWFNGQACSDVLSPDAVRRFIEITHERYHDVLGEEFGHTIPAIFTDEPQVARKTTLGHPDASTDQFLPYTSDFGATYLAAYGDDLEERLPELLWDSASGGSMQTRHRYFDHLAERFVYAFTDQLAEWCGQHGIALTGHFMSEENLHGQATATGEIMRHYRKMQLPGIDLLCDRRDYSAAKQAQSAARQYGRCGALSELYGSTNWDFPFVGHKGQGDWQAVLGITVRVPHLAWMTMYGDAKRDWPASIFFQAPWWKEYAAIEDHFARLNVAMTRGKALCRVAMLHPVETFWVSNGPRSQNGIWNEGQEETFQQGVRWLLMGLVDFDFLAESLLPEQCADVTGTALNVGQMAYDVVIVPPLRTIRATTLERLEKLVERGGTVLFGGEVPSFVDALPSNRAQQLAARCQRIGWSRLELLEALEEYRDISAERLDGQPTDCLIYQFREEGENRWLLLANVDRQTALPQTRLKIRGQWSPMLWDSFTGQSRPLATTYSAGQTILTHDFEAAGHLLLQLAPGRSTVAAPPRLIWQPIGELPAPTYISLDEPNVLLLDQAEFRLDDGPWQSREEHLRIQNAARTHFGIAPITNHVIQPWADAEPAPRLGTLSLRFTIDCEAAVAAPLLALEDLDSTTIWLDGQPIAAESVGWWVDPCLRQVQLPSLSIGRHELVLSRPFDRKSNVERCYLLGDFGVRVAGRFTWIVEPVRHLQWGDWTTQGLPFYAGNVTYHCLFLHQGELAIRLPHHATPLLKVNDSLAMVPPFRVPLETAGETVAITAFGNRYNAFGNLHLANPDEKYHGPATYRTTGDAWSYEYQLKPMGVLSAPIVEQSH